MIIFTILKFLVKTIVGLVIFALIAGRLFFAKETEALVINPARQVPIIGSVFGSAWDGAGQIGPTITKKTVEMADKVETSDLQIEEAVLGVTKSENPKDEVTKAIEKQVAEKADQLKDLPSNLIEKAKAEIRQELYAQVCQDWAPEENASTGENTH